MFTSETTHAVLGETATRALAYVAMTRGRHTNTAYLYERTAEHEYGQRPIDDSPVTRRGTHQHAVRLLRGIVAHDDQSKTALSVATANTHETLPARICRAIDQQAIARRRRGNEYQRWLAASVGVDSAAREGSSRMIGTHTATDYALEI